MTTHPETSGLTETRRILFGWLAKVCEEARPAGFLVDGLYCECSFVLFGGVS